MRYHRISPLLLCAYRQWEAVLCVMTTREMVVPGFLVVGSIHLVLFGPDFIDGKFKCCKK